MQKTQNQYLQSCQSHLLSAVVSTVLVNRLHPHRLRDTPPKHRQIFDRTYVEDLEDDGLLILRTGVKKVKLRQFI